MDINIKAIKFEATMKLQEFIQKKVSKLDRFCDNIMKVEVSLKVVKPETALNKSAGVKICDSFEEAVTEALGALEKQLSKYKEKQSKA